MACQPLDSRAAAGFHPGFDRGFALFPSVLVIYALMTAKFGRGELASERPACRLCRDRASGRAVDRDRGCGRDCRGAPLAACRAVLGAARSNAALLERRPRGRCWSAPTRRIEVDAQLLRDLGLERRRQRASPTSSATTAASSPTTSSSLRGDVEAARVSAGQRVARVRARTARPRVFDVRGGPARARAGGHAAAVVLRHQRERGGARQARARACARPKARWIRSRT